MNGLFGTSVPDFVSTKQTEPSCGILGGPCVFSPYDTVAGEWRDEGTVGCPLSRSNGGPKTTSYPERPVGKWTGVYSQVLYLGESTVDLDRGVLGLRTPSASSRHSKSQWEEPYDLFLMSFDRRNGRRRKETEIFINWWI